MPPTPKPDYGLDAPSVVRNLLVIGGALLVASASALAGLWSGMIRIGPVNFALAQAGLWPGVSLTLMGCYMIWSSRVGKVRHREKILDRLHWRGDEQVLDVGCGRGLMLIGAAKRLGTGKAVGIDIWRAEDLSGNDPDATIENARREGVTDRVELRTEDMRNMSFPDAQFDVAVTCAAIHNLDAAADRRLAIHEIMRVMRPSGTIVIDDIRHGREYAALLQAGGWAQIKRLDSPIGSVLWALITFGSMRPIILQATRN